MDSARLSTSFPTRTGLSNEAVLARLQAVPRQIQPAALGPVDHFATTPTVSLPTRILNGARSLGSTLKKVGLAAVAVVPTLASLVAARELSQIDGVLTGKSVSALDWLRNRLPGVYSFDVNNLLSKVGSLTTDAIGLSPTQLVDVDRNLYTMLAPTTDAKGVKTVPTFLRQLGEAAFKDPKDPYAAYVYMGDDKASQAQQVMNLWNSPDRPTTNPFNEKDPNFAVWNTLLDRTRAGDFPVYVDLDGDPNTYTSTEYLARETVASLWQRGDHVGKNYSETGLYYAWLTQRLDTNYQVLDPWVASQSPELHSQINQVKSDLAPAWLGGQGVGPFPPADKVDKAFTTMKKIADGPQTAYADAAISLDRDILTGVQTQWIKLMRESGPERRTELLKPLAKAWVELALSDGPEVSPPGAPGLKSVDANASSLSALPTYATRPFHRAMGLGEVLDHTLDGLGINERKQLMESIRSEMRSHMPQLQAREAELRQQLGSAYPGIDVQAAVDGTADPDSLKPLKAQLGGPPSPVQSRTARYWDMLDWSVNATKEYGDIDLSLSGKDPAFAKQPLAVSEFFNQTEKAPTVSPLGEGPNQIKPLGLGQNEGDPTKVSMVFEGGGGKGFAYIACLKQLQESLNASKANLAIDQFVGTSAGAITAGLLAAGFDQSQLGDVMAKLDFNKFNADAVWLEGGVDPKVRGIDRTGMFSMQNMYTTLYGLLSEKLGIEGRPILFRDLPFRFTASSTVLNTDLPKDDPMRKQIDSDGRIIMSSDTTPNFDVVGAIIASAAVPGFYNSPQMEVFRGDKRYHIQFCDGGTVDNMPVTEADKSQEMVMMPAHIQAVDPKTGQTVSLSTLNFDDSNMQVLNQHNEDLYKSFAPQLGKFLTDTKPDRAVLAFHLAKPDEQPLPIVQGQDKAATARLFAQAKAEGMPQMDSAAGRKVVDGVTHKPEVKRRLGGEAYQLFLQAPGARTPIDFHLLGNSTYTPEEHESTGVLNAATVAGAAAFSAVHRPFET